MGYKQEPPFCIQVELTLGCNLGCHFCGINGIGYQHGERGFEYMTPKTAEKIAKNIAKAGWNPRIEFARRGEPSLNPDAAEIVGIFRKHLPKVSMMMTANGGGLLKKPGPYERVSELFDAGLNVLALDDYYPNRLVTKIVERLPDDYFWKHNIDYYEYPQQKEGNPHKRRNPNTREFVRIEDIMTASKGTHSHINNHGGYAAPVRSFPKPCAKPFREMSVNFDGTVNHCCIAWAGEMVCGNIAKEDVEKVWNNERFFAVRQKLIRGQRDFGTCKGCDHPSYRVGLLPDKKGQDKSAYPEPTKKTEKVIKEMVDEGFPIEPSSQYFKFKDGGKSKSPKVKKRPTK